MTGPFAIGSLFSGIGGLELGLERAGLGSKSEVDPFCREILRRHWPDAELFGNAHEIDFDQVPSARVICAGFPCQPHAAHGLRKGTNDDRWGWPAVVRALDALRPDVLVLENVRNLLRTGFEVLLEDLRARGFDAEWSCLRACDVGLPHARQRVFVVAYPRKVGLQVFGPAYDDDGRLALGDVTNGCNARIPPGPAEDPDRWARYLEAGPPPGLRRRLDGIPRRVDRVASLGNAVPPRMSYAVGRLVVEAFRRRVVEPGPVADAGPWGAS